MLPYVKNNTKSRLNILYTLMLYTSPHIYSNAKPNRCGYHVLSIRKKNPRGWIYQSNIGTAAITVRCPQILRTLSVPDHADFQGFTSYVQRDAPQDMISHPSTTLKPHTVHFCTFTKPNIERQLFVNMENLRLF